MGHGRYVRTFAVVAAALVLPAPAPRPALAVPNAPGAWSSTAYEPAPIAPTQGTQRIRRLLRSLATRDENPVAGYTREQFPHWIDANADGCHTREAVLIRDSKVRATRSLSCTVTAGRWVSPYDGRTWTDAQDVDIDHVVALHEAWLSGAHAWPAAQRRAFANDLRFPPSLRAVTDNVNASKGDRDPAEWLPDRARCAYVISWIRVKYRWRLSVDPRERTALRELMDGSCGDRRVGIPERAR